MKKTVLICDGCETEQREPNVALSDIDVKDPERGLYIKEWRGMHLCLNCRQVYGRIQRRLDTQTEAVSTININVPAVGPAVRKELVHIFRRLQ